MPDLPDTIAELYLQRRHHIMNERFPRQSILDLPKFLWAARYFETGCTAELDFANPAFSASWPYAVDTLDTLAALSPCTSPADLVQLQEGQIAAIVRVHGQAAGDALSTLWVPAGSGQYHRNDCASFVLHIDLLIAYMARVEHDAAYRLDALSLRDAVPASNPPALAASVALQGLPTTTIADLFECDRRSRETWLKASPKWLSGALLQRGKQGGAPSVWCPVKVAMAMHARKLVGIEDLNRRFSNPALAPWRGLWDRFYSVFSDADGA